IFASDFVCIVLSPDTASPALWYEAGIATGSSRPLLVVAGDEAVRQMPFNLFSAPLIRYREDAIALLQDNLRAYVRNVQPIAAQLKIDWERLIEAPPLTVKEAPEPQFPVIERDLQRQLVQHFSQIGVL